MTDTLDNPTKIRKLKDGTSASELKDFFSEYPILNEKILNDLDGESLLKLRLRKTCPKSYAAVTSVKLFWVKKINQHMMMMMEDAVGAAAAAATVE